MNSHLIKKPKGCEEYSCDDLQLWEVRETEWYANLGKDSEPEVVRIDWFQVKDDYVCTGYGRKYYGFLEKELSRLGFSKIILNID